MKLSFRLATSVLLLGSIAFAQSNAREAQILKKIKVLYKGLDSVLSKLDAEKAVKYYTKSAKVYPKQGKPIEAVDGIVAFTTQYQLSKALSYKSSTKSIRVVGNTAYVETVARVVATLPQRGYSDRFTEVVVRSVTKDKWVYQKGWKIQEVRTVEDRMWWDGKEQVAKPNRKG